VGAWAKTAIAANARHAYALGHPIARCAMDERKMPYLKPSLETIDVQTLTEAVGPVQAFSSGSQEPAIAPTRLTSGTAKPLKKR
jgi:hypothetical protein